jgi:aryl sulfotransferase
MQSQEGWREYRSATTDNRRWDAFVHRPGDIFICTPRKCGTTWMQTIVASLLWPAGDVPDAVTVISPWFDASIEPLHDVVARLESQTHRRFVKTHTPADGIPWFSTGRYVVMGRDGRDAFMSQCNHMERLRANVRASIDAAAAADGLPGMPAWNGDIHAFFTSWLADGELFDHIATFWERRTRPNVLLAHHADFTADLDGEMRRLADFLEIDVPGDAWPEVVDRCRFDQMRRRSQEIGQFGWIFEGGAKSFLFKGTNGRWRDVLTDDELAAYARRVANVLPPDAAAWLEHGFVALGA